MEKEILKKFVKKGYLLDKSLLKILSSKEKKELEELLEKIISLKIKEKILTEKILEKNNIFLKKNDENDENNLDFDVIVDNTDVKKEKITLNSFVEHFKSRYNKIRDILIEKDIDNLTSIRRISNINSSYNIIGMVMSKKTTKNNNIILEVEDLTGKISVLINKEKKEIFDLSKNIMLDDVLCFKTSGSRDILFCNGIIFPDSYLSKRKTADNDEYIAFLGDLHFGSSFFLEKEFLRFIQWINGNIGDERQKSMAKKIKYLFLTGDNVDGVSIFPNQNKYLKIKSSRGQYKGLYELLNKIRKDIGIIICPGQHDSVWVGEKQYTIPEKWAKDLHEAGNIFLTTNPSYVKIRDFDILVYHGASINRFIDEIPEIRIKYGHDKPLEIVKEMLRIRHLAPTHGLMDYIPKENDELVIDKLPDVFVIGDQHRANFDYYNNILLVSGSCWIGKTPFEEKIGSNPDPCKVALFNLKSRETKILDFSSEKKIDEVGNE